MPSWTVFWIALGISAIVMFALRLRRTAFWNPFGVMSDQWIAEQRANTGDRRPR
jgi:hypothetical protein